MPVKHRPALVASVHTKAIIFSWPFGPYVHHVCSPLLYKGHVAFVPLKVTSPRTLWTARTPKRKCLSQLRQKENTPLNYQKHLDIIHRVEKGEFCTLVKGVQPQCINDLRHFQEQGEGTEVFHCLRDWSNWWTCSILGWDFNMNWTLVADVFVEADMWEHPCWWTSS